jgi:DNA processing protein
MTGDDLACAAALLDLPGMTPVRLARVLDGFGPALAWHAVRAGTHPGDRSRRFAAAARGVVPRDAAARYAAAGVSLLVPGATGYPTALTGDPGAPAVLTALGDPTVVEGRPAVAVVGTRSATPYGASVAAELGRGLADAGVVVVSGLALGIDAAAHAGALDAGAGGAPPVAVVGTGLDVVYPRGNRALWERVAARGAVLSEAPLGTRALPRVFPARNRIIAALADVVVVVECHGQGGSFHTVEAAARRAVPVCAVPGSVRSPASRGTNGLLVDGCAPVRDLDDVLTALALARGGRAPEAGRGLPRPRAPGADRRLDGLDRGERAVWDAVDDTPTTVETVLLRTGLAVAAVGVAVEALVVRGLLIEGAGWWSRAGTTRG